jgi:RNA 3'-terminal phosphate cyclase (ATP)
MSAERRTIELSGAHGEGGGALVRTALAMSALTFQPVRIQSVRGAMRVPGLTPEELAIIEALAVSTDADVAGAELESTELTFSPRRQPRALRQKIDLSVYDRGKVNGSAVIVLEALLPVLSRTGAVSSVRLRGETHCQGALSFDGFERSTLQAHAEQGMGVSVSLGSAGIGRGGTGEISSEIEPSQFAPLVWKERGRLLESGATVTYSDLNRGQVDEILGEAEDKLGKLGLMRNAEELSVRSNHAGASLTFWAKYESGQGSCTAVTDRGLHATELVRSVSDEMQRWLMSDATVDEHLADQILLAAAFAEGKTTFTTPCVTKRITTMSWVIKQFLPVRLTILGREGERGTVTTER